MHSPTHRWLRGKLPRDTKILTESGKLTPKVLAFFGDRDITTRTPPHLHTSSERCHKRGRILLAEGRGSQEGGEEFEPLFPSYFSVCGRREVPFSHLSDIPLFLLLGSTQGALKSTTPCAQLGRSPCRPTQRVINLPLLTYSRGRLLLQSPRDRITSCREKENIGPQSGTTSPSVRARFNQAAYSGMHGP